MEIHITMEDLGIWPKVLGFLFIEYTLVLLAIIADLWSGVRKAKKIGEARTSYGFKRTVTKICKYYNALLAFTVVDFMQMICAWYLADTYGYRIPIIPVLTLIAAIGLGIIEIKSIYEKVEDKVRFDDVAILAGKIASNKTDPKEIARAVVDYLNNDKQKEENEKENTKGD